MVSKLATFRTDDEIWQDFQDKAKANGTNASALLQRFVRDYLDDKLDNRINRTAAATDVDIESMINEAIAKQLDDRDRVINLAIGSMRELFETAIADNRAATDELLAKFEALEATVSLKKSQLLSPQLRAVAVQKLQAVASSLSHCQSLRRSPRQMSQNQLSDRKNRNSMMVI